MNTSGTTTTAESDSRKKKAYQERIRMTRHMVERVDKIHTRLYLKTYPTLAGLAREFGVEARTIRRDFHMIRYRLKHKIVWNQQKKGYEYEGEVAACADLLLMEAEVVALMIAGNAMQSALFGDWGEKLNGILGKITESLPGSFSIDLGDWEDAISFHYIGEPKFDGQFFQKVIMAIVQRKELRVLYESDGEEPAERVMKPYGMAFINREWILFAYDYKRKMVRCFTPPRMKAVEETGKTFVRPASFSVKKELKNTFGVYKSNVLYDVVIRFKKSAAHETRQRWWPKGHRLETLPDGSVDLHMTLSHLQDIHTFILSMGGKVIPVLPQQLCDLHIATTTEMRDQTIKLNEEMRGISATQQQKHSTP